MEVIQVPDRPASQMFYAVAGRLLFIECIDVRLGNLIEGLFAGWQLQPVLFVEREPDVRINFFCGDALPHIPGNLNQFEIADGGRCYTNGDDYYVSIGNSLIHLQNSRQVIVGVWLAELPGPVDPVFTRSTSFAVCAALRRFGLFELHSAGVVHPNLERRVGGHGVGHACPALVENDQSGKRGDALEEGAQERNGPRKLDVRGRAGNEDDVERPVAGDTVGDVDVAAARVADFGDHGRIIKE